MLRQAWLSETQDVLAGVSVATKTLICTALRDVLEAAASHRNYSGDLPAHKACTHLRTQFIQGRCRANMARIRHYPRPWPSGKKL